MEAKDTVMSDEQIGELLGEIPTACDYATAEMVAEAQAVITWDTAFKAGMREVAGWVEANSRKPIDMGVTFRSRWQAKLKEWDYKASRRAQ